MTGGLKTQTQDIFLLNNKMLIEHKTARLTINSVRDSQSMTALSYHERDSSYLRSFS